MGLTDNGAIIKSHYKFKPTEINNKPSEAIKIFQAEGFECQFKENSDNIDCQKFKENGEILQRILLIVSVLGDEALIEEVEVTNYI